MQRGPVLGQPACHWCIGVFRLNGHKSRRGVFLFHQQKCGALRAKKRRKRAHSGLGDSLRLQRGMKTLQRLFDRCPVGRHLRIERRVVVLLAGQCRSPSGKSAPAVAVTVFTHPVGWVYNQATPLFAAFPTMKHRSAVAAN